ncbi:PREDICTED: GDSL esterase/lipase 5-like [Nelumbo nucifera]|uniref:GDSL esterase/lipase 5-like n=2 Tax=Nelumbo nucifera TaxID=4432 RepID=A0A822ZDL8_NELNU|nr:PREDICTED: GDSL esterase/lipase 5-like [Nelumbo nucifera]DAD42673.1 TPA_asm: hypothetical protein HUJ06_000903 [Nelumbo nucifera]
MAKLSFLFCILALHRILLVPSSCSGHLRQPETPVPFFIFGDSILDPGNNNYINTTTQHQANFWPYGETFFEYSTGRCSDGRLISDFIAKYAKLPMIPPYLQPGVQFNYGANFASAGAGALVETYQGEVIDLKTQLKYFEEMETSLRHKLGDAETKKFLSRAVYLFSIGNNDYMSPFSTVSSMQETSQKELVGRVIGNLTAVIKEIHDRGGRKFAFLNMGPLGCLPGMRALAPGRKGGCLKDASHLAKLHNAAFSQLLLKLESQLDGFKYSNINLYSYISQIMEHPTNYGFKEGITACCGSGPFRGIYSCGGRRGVKRYELCDKVSEYVWWDSFHPSERVYQLIAEQMWNGNPNVVEPYSLKSLFEWVEV